LRLLIRIDHNFLIFIVILNWAWRWLMMH
jgi:hypothetical protein